MNIVPSVISPNELVEILRNVNNRVMVEITTSTDPDMRKTNNPFIGKVKKVQTLRVTLNQDYAELVNSARILEGKTPDFQAKPRPWGVKIQNTPLVENKGSFYVEGIVSGEAPAPAIYKMLGIEIDKSILLPFLPAKNESAKRNQLLDKNEVTVRTFKVENIVALKIENKFYIVH